jgi:predicted TIM-barrel fold metal-dependent hydrolase
MNEWALPLIDFHTHIGKVKIETTKGASQRINRPQDILDLYEKLKFEIHQRISNKPSDYYIELPPIENFSRPLYPLVKQLLDHNDGKIRGWLVDHVVTFPFNDIFHKKTSPKFIKSNQYVRHQTQSWDYSFRFFPFCRVDPTDEGADKELIDSVNLGMRGVKLHPMSQNWIEKITSSESKQVLQTIGKVGVPVIFDVPNKGVAIDITTVSEDARKDSNLPINVVLGHTGFDYSSPEIFDCLAKPDMFTETSGMRGEDVKIFFKNVMKINDWENKIVFGTDHNYFSVLQAADFITFLFSFEFKELLSESDNANKNPFVIASMILGGNALRIIPSAWHSNMITSNNKQFKTKFSNLTSTLKKFSQKRGNYATIDLANSNKDNLVQILTLGIESKKISFIINDNKSQKECILQQNLDGLKIIEEIPKLWDLSSEIIINEEIDFPELTSNKIVEIFEE